MGAAQLKERTIMTPAPAKRPAKTKRKVAAKKRVRTVSRAKAAQQRAIRELAMQCGLIFVFTWVAISIVGYTLMLGARRDARVANKQSESALAEARRIRTEIDELNNPRELNRVAARLRLYPGGVNLAEIPAVAPAAPKIARTGGIDVQVR